MVVPGLPLVSPTVLARASPRAGILAPRSHAGPRCRRGETYGQRHGGVRDPRRTESNGLPVLASDRGALPETLGDAGFVFTLPERCTPNSGAVPTAREVAPWLAVIERLWDDPAWESAHRTRARDEARRWEPAELMGRYQDFFGSLTRLTG